MKNWGTLVRVYGKYKYHLVTLIFLGLLGAILDGVAINIAIPSLSFLTNPHAVPTDVISRMVASVFFFFGISFTFRHLIIFITILLFIRAIVLVIFGYIRGWVTGDFLASESTGLLDATLSATWPFLLKQKTGYVQNNFSRDLQRSANLLESFSQVAQSSTGFLMYLLVALNISPTTTLFTVGAGAVLALLIRPLLRRTQVLGQEMAQTERAVNQFIVEQLIGMKVIKALGVQQKVHDHGRKFFEKLRNLYTRMSFVRSLSTSFFQPFAMVFIIILFTFTYTSGSFDLISFAATLYLIQKIFTYLESSQAALGGVRELIPYAVHIDEFKQALLHAREQRDVGHTEFILRKEISFRDVTFSYSEQSPLLQKISFSIEVGKTTAIIGPSGSGKTSVVDLLLNLFTPEKGDIYIDDMPLRDVSVQDLRSRLGYVTQDAFLLNDTIAENIRFYRPTISDADIDIALAEAHLADFVKTLPEGKETVVGDRGVLLSGGQRQRIALARALAGSPSLLILDEATSALDRESESLVQESIEALHGKITVVVIAHRLQTIQKADKIIVLEKGEVLEQGSPTELLQNPHSYYTKHSA